MEHPPKHHLAVSGSGSTRRKNLGPVQTKSVSCFRNGMMLTRQLQKAAQSVRGRVKGDFVERKAWTRDSVGAGGTGRMPSKSDRGQQRGRVQGNTGWGARGAWATERATVTGRFPERR